MRQESENSQAFDQKVSDVCQLYQRAHALYQQGIHLISCDEKTGIQAIEREIVPMKTGRVELRESEYIRHGTQCVIANFEVATGKVIAPSIGESRTEADFTIHIAYTLQPDPRGEWIFLVDNLNIHKSASLVRLIAKTLQLDTSLGEKGKEGILKSLASREAFLSTPDHRIRFVYLPKHTSWLNQVELWFSILVRRLLKRLSVKSKYELNQKIAAFIEYFNKTLAKPFQWTYTGRPLTI